MIVRRLFSFDLKQFQLTRVGSGFVQWWPNMFWYENDNLCSEATKIVQRWDKSLCGAIPWQEPVVAYSLLALQWRHNGVWNHRRIDCLLNRMFRRRLKKHQGSASLALVRGNSPVTGEFPAQRLSNADSCEQTPANNWLISHNFYSRKAYVNAVCEGQPFWSGISV